MLDHWVQVAPHPISQEEIQDAQAIAVLGGNRDRVHEAATLHMATGLPILVVGKGTGDAPFKAESEKMAWILRTQYGIEPRWVETRSRDTHQNAEYAWCMVAPQGVQRLVLVTGARHMRRARSEFEAAGFGVIPAPMPEGEQASGLAWADFMPSRRGLNEVLGVAKEWFAGTFSQLRGLTDSPSECDLPEK